MNIVLNAGTEKALRLFIESPSHAVLLTGPTGSGKHTLAYKLATDLLPNDTFENYPYKLIIQPTDDKTIGIEAIREIEHLLSLKVPRPEGINRLVIIEQAQKLTREAQNALLKTLEEPPVGTVLILTSDSAQSLLPTVQSRVQFIAVQAPSYEQLRAAYLAHGHVEADISRAYSMTGGLPGLMQAILSDQDHPLRAATDLARAILSESSYQRMLRVETLSKDKSLASNILFILQQMAHVSLKTADGAAAKRWESVLTVAYDASEALTQSAQPKLTLTKLMLTL